MESQVRGQQDSAPDPAGPTLVGGLGDHWCGQRLGRLGLLVLEARLPCREVAPPAGGPGEPRGAEATEPEMVGGVGRVPGALGSLTLRP